MSASPLANDEIAQLIHKQTEVLAQVTQAIHKQNELLEKGNKNTNMISTATKAFEMRQCQSSGEATDAIRMSEFYYRGESAQLSSNAQQRFLEMLYEEGTTDGVEYHKLFGDKDTRRAELATVVFYETVMSKGTVKPYNTFQTSTDQMRALLKLMPSFRKVMMENAKAKDRELGPVKVEGLLHGSYEARIKGAIGPIPSGLQMLHEMVLGMDKQYRPVPKSHPDAETPLCEYDLLPEQIKAEIEMAINMGLVTSDNKAIAATELVFTWCTTIAELSDKQWDLDEEEYLNKKAKSNAEAEKRAELNKNIMARHIENNYKELHAITEKHEKLQTKWAAAKETAKASGKQTTAEASDEPQA